MKAALVSVDFEKEKVMADFFIGKTAAIEADQLREAIQEDWPHCKFVIVADGEDVQKEFGKYRMRKFGLL